MVLPQPDGPSSDDEFAVADLQMEIVDGCGAGEIFAETSKRNECHELSWTIQQENER